MSRIRDDTMDHRYHGWDNRDLVLPALDVDIVILPKDEGSNIAGVIAVVAGLCSAVKIAMFAFIEFRRGWNVMSEGIRR